MKNMILPILLLVIVLISIVVLVTTRNKEYQQWYNSLTVEEQQQIKQEKLEKYESKIERYEVVSVSRYVKENTNALGGVISTDICYSFFYVDGAGNLRHKDGFAHLDYGLTKVTIGESNQYIVNNNTLDSTYTLQLTKDTLKNLE